MKTQEKIKKLRDKGLKVDVLHYRVHPLRSSLGRYFRGKGFLAEEPTPVEVETEKPNTKGGSTEVYIHKDGNLLAHGEALCSDRDTFSYKVGSTIALGRALKEYNASAGN